MTRRRTVCGSLRVVYTMRRLPHFPPGSPIATSRAAHTKANRHIHVAEGSDVRRGRRGSLLRLPIGIEAPEGKAPDLRRRGHQPPSRISSGAPRRPKRLLDSQPRKRLNKALRISYLPNVNAGAQRNLKYIKSYLMAADRVNRRQ